MHHRIISSRDAKQKDLVDYLASLDHQPQKIRGNDHWYLSPLREEKTPSFKVNKKFNIWYDHGIGKGGTLIDFGILYHGCTVAEFLQKLSSPLSFQQPKNYPLTGQPSPNSGEAGPVQKDPDPGKSKIKIISEKAIESPALIEYLTSRSIPVALAEKYCKQIDFELYGKTITALGFPNRSGGYELRNPNFKGSNSPKDVSFLDNGKPQIAVFEGFFSFLSFQKINQQPTEDLTNFLVLNSLAFFEKSYPLMEQHAPIHLFLDRDPAGSNCTKKALERNANYLDRSDFYIRYKDLNEWLQEQVRQKEVCKHIRRHR